MVAYFFNPKLMNNVLIVRFKKEAKPNMFGKFEGCWKETEIESDLNSNNT